MEFEEMLWHPTTGNPIQVTSGWEKTKTSIIFRWHYDHLFPDGHVERNVVRTEHNLAGLDQHIAELKLEKFNPIQILGDYAYSEYELSSPYVIIIARREV
jgi:hypothetical protein